MTCRETVRYNSSGNEFVLVGLALGNPEPFLSVAWNWQNRDKNEIELK